MTLKNNLLFNLQELEIMNPILHHVGFVFDL